ncbi:NAD(P)H-binding protein [Sulfurospirillum arsenophilum]|uniref:NAD(P)H-binding protein n=1 Tax=Sulfurospirillum arsenophilum TaxID=56698 RepID=UPI0005AB6FF6|nr:NAD(P)H-binding protein [Sulfurospirillum arsenophilum]
MKRVLILGANGQIARVAIDMLLKDTNVKLTLFLRNAKRLKHIAQNNNVELVEGDVLDKVALKLAMDNQDIVYANLSGNLEAQAKTIVEVMNQTGIKRLIFISSMGIYNEVPGEHYGSILDPYRKSASIIEASELDYTIIRPAWLNNQDEISYETTQKGEGFKNASASVSRKSVADLVMKLVSTPTLGVHQSLGVHKA